MMWVRGLAAAHQTRLLGDIPEVVAVAIAARGGYSECALVAPRAAIVVVLRLGTRIGGCATDILVLRQRVAGDVLMAPFSRRHGKVAIGVITCGGLVTWSFRQLR